MDSVGAVSEAEVDDGGGVCVGAGGGPEEVGGVEVVVGPEGGEGGEKRLQLGMKGCEEFEGVGAGGAGDCVAAEGGPGG